MGMPVVEAEVVRDADGRAGLLVRRFDRVPGPGGTTVALACEDACQLLDRWPADKYQVSSEELVGRVGSVCAASAVARRDVFRQLSFAWATGNGDVHAKNISVLAGPDGEHRVAPAYDLPSTVPYGDKSLALPLAGRRTGLSHRRLTEFGTAIGLPGRAVDRVITSVLAGTEAVIADLEQGALPFPRPVLQATVKELRFRRRQMAT
jgi:serine/threonine-protein kinase HipA